METAMARKHAIERSDLLSMDEYARQRADWRRRMSAMKKRRRVEVGPFVTFYFENWQTMWHQIHEMLFIERGGDAQIPDELEAYNPLVPQGSDLSATFMIEIDDPDRRKRMLGRLGGIDEIFEQVGFAGGELAELVGEAHGADFFEAEVWELGGEGGHELGIEDVAGIDEAAVFGCSYRRELAVAVHRGAILRTVLPPDFLETHAAL